MASRHLKIHQRKKEIGGRRFERSSFTQGAQGKFAKAAESIEMFLRP